MRFSTLLTSLYGELRGYRRLRIRREALAGERLDRDALVAMNDRLFQAHVQRCLVRFPFYAEKVRQHRGALPAPDERVEPAELPVWTRHDQRAFFDQQVRPPDAAYAHQTSGSTSLPVRFYVTRESYEWRTAITDRAYRWGHAEEGARTLQLWAADQKQPATSVRMKRLVHRFLQRRVYFDAFSSMDDEHRAACIAVINRVRPVSIVGYTGVIVDLARYARAHPGALTHRPFAMVSAAEGLQPGQRELLEANLVEHVFLSYGSREFMNVGMECEHHTGYHLMIDNILAEVVGDDGQPAAPGETGRIVVTDLHNAATPFIRYEIGDLGVMAPPDERCPCGRAFPLLRSVEGRLQDVVRLRDGQRVSALFVTYVMRQFDWVEGWQVVQPSPDEITVRVLCASPLTPAMTAPVEDMLRKKLGSAIQIHFVCVDELTRRASGKVQLVISDLPDA